MEGHQLPDMGKHLVLDFQNIETGFDVNSYEQVSGLFKRILADNNIDIISEQHKIFEPQGLTIVFLLHFGHFTIHTWPETKSCAIDFYKYETTTQVIKNVEESLCEALGWKAATSTITLPRGVCSKLHTNHSSEKSEIIKNVSLVHRERTQFQELRIYDTQSIGRIMLLDGMIQISDELEDNYTIDMSRKVVTKDRDYEHILIIGGGDLIIARYLLEKFPNVKKITLCEIDKRVTDCTKEYFSCINETIQKGIDAGKLEIVNDDGAVFAKGLAQRGIKVDGIIVDCTDVWIDGGVANSLFTSEFYSSLNQIMTPGAHFSQQLSDEQFLPQYREKWTKGGFTEFSHFACISPEYGIDLPIGDVIKN